MRFVVGIFFDENNFKKKNQKYFEYDQKKYNNPNQGTLYVQLGYVNRCPNPEIEKRERSHHCRTAKNIFMRLRFLLGANFSLRLGILPPQDRLNLVLFF